MSKQIGLGNMTPTMTKQQKDQVERMTDAQIEKHFRSHRDTPDGRNFAFWNHDHTPQSLKQYRDNFDSIFPNAPGAGI